MHLLVQNYEELFKPAMNHFSQASRVEELTFLYKYSFDRLHPHQGCQDWLAYLR